MSFYCNLNLLNQEQADKCGFEFSFLVCDGFQFAHSKQNFLRLKLDGSSFFCLNINFEKRFIACYMQII